MTFVIIFFLNSDMVVLRIHYIFNYGNDSKFFLTDILNKYYILFIFKNIVISNNYTMTLRQLHDWPILHE